MKSHEKTACSRAAAHIAQAIVLLKFLPEELAGEVIEALKPMIRRTERIGQ